MKALAALALALLLSGIASSSAAESLPPFLKNGASYMFFTDASVPAITGTVTSVNSFPWVCVRVTTKHGCWTQWLNMDKVSSVRPVAEPITCSDEKTRT